MPGHHMWLCATIFIFHSFRRMHNTVHGDLARVVRLLLVRCAEFGVAAAATALGQHLVPAHS